MVYRNDLIRAAIVNRDLSKQKFAEDAELAPGTVAKLWNGDENIELPSLIKASEFLDIPLHRLFEPREEAASISG